MLGRKRKTKDPCQTCYLHKDRCICAQIPHLNTQTRVCLVVHEKELKRTTNTGRLATHCLINSEMRIRGKKDKPLDLSDLLRLPYAPLLLFPSDDAHELNADFSKNFTKPVLLIVPDGNWRQASKVHSRHEELRQIPRIFLKKKETNSQPVLRRETMKNGMATLESIAEALSMLESPAVGATLRQLYELKLRQTLLGRGQLI